MFSELFSAARPKTGTHSSNKIQPLSVNVPTTSALSGSFHETGVRPLSDAQLDDGGEKKWRFWTVI